MLIYFRQECSDVFEGPRWIPKPKMLKMLKLASLRRSISEADPKLAMAFALLKQVYWLGMVSVQAKNIAHELRALASEVQPYLKLRQQFKLADKQYQSYRRFLEYMREQESSVE